MTEPQSPYAAELAELREACREMRGLLRDSELAIARLREAQAVAEKAAAGRVAAYEKELEGAARKSLERIWKEVGAVIEASEKRIIAKFASLTKLLLSIPTSMQGPGVSSLEDLITDMAAGPLGSHPTQASGWAAYAGLEGDLLDGKGLPTTGPITERTEETEQEVLRMTRRARRHKQRRG